MLSDKCRNTILCHIHVLLYFSRDLATATISSSLQSIFKVLGLTQFLTNHLKNLYIVLYVCYLDAAPTTSSYFTSLNFQFFMLHPWLEGMENQKFRKQKLELVDVGAPRLDIYRSIYKVLRQFVINWVSSSTSKMDQERRWNCGSGRVTWKIQ